jgi:hypothetical protein
MRSIPENLRYPSGSKGVTLLETVVAATLLGLAFVGITSMLASGRDMETTEYLRRQAFRLAVVAMEDSAFGPGRYSLLTTVPVARNNSLRTPAGQNVAALVSIAVGPESNMTFQDTSTHFSPGRPIEFKRVDAKVSWTFAGRPDSVILMKRIAKIP